MTSTSQVSGPMLDLVAAVRDGLKILGEERDVFLSGGYDRIADVTARKLDMLKRLEDAIRAAPKSREALDTIARLIAESRRNEQIIQSARQGLAHARRRLETMKKTGRGVVAYAEDGAQIMMRPGHGDKERSV